ncbi:CPBP family intramembrane glutamic endopeptidase [Corynebacterium pacaense]|uniref:CPBP family intramembrane glutamic endopeptidase n=1 Tax=Corynebacterium pacaense TaxID=1816684 RepID=UPI0009BAF8C1|nr:CPBP family intramembrane glutamic endopeptidase [Corynebacterium pacaense]
MTFHKRKIRDIIAVVAALIGINLIAHFTSLNPWVTVPAGALIVFALARVLGLSWDDLGVSSPSISKGIRYGGVCILATAVVVMIAVAVPFLREFFLNDAYSSIRTALLAAFVIIPLCTVLPEELLFRGVLHGALERFGGMKAAFLGGSVLFGFWHVASSLNLTAGNAGLVAVLGSGSFGKWVGVGLAVVATSLAGAGFIWLRHRTNSVIAPIGMHWALNSVGALAAAMAFQLQ